MIAAVHQLPEISPGTFVDGLIRGTLGVGDGRRFDDRLSVQPLFNLILFVRDSYCPPNSAHYADLAVDPAEIRLHYIRRICGDCGCISGNGPSGPQ